MVIPLSVDEDYGLVILVGVLSILLERGLSLHVMFARKRFRIEYPKMYSEENLKFNCIQRVHGNYLEFFPQFLVLLFCGGLAHPMYSAIAGAIYLLGRVVYSIGYSTGDPNKRLFGLFGYLGVLYLLYSTLELAVRLLRWL